MLLDTLDAISELGTLAERTSKQPGKPGTQHHPEPYRSQPRRRGCKHPVRVGVLHGENGEEEWIDRFTFFCHLRGKQEELTEFRTRGCDPWQIIHCWLMEFEDQSEAEQPVPK